MKKIVFQEARKQRLVDLPARARSAVGVIRLAKQNVCGVIEHDIAWPRVESHHEAAVNVR